ncbi:hypothetical protein JCM8097_000187 [Rhodosporidiobolus ruineniae]
MPVPLPWEPDLPVILAAPPDISSEAYAAFTALSNLPPASPAPPSVPFDAPSPSDDSTLAWTNWLDERRARRETLAAASATVGLPPTVRSTRSLSVSSGTSARLERLRASAERLRSVDRRAEEEAAAAAARMRATDERLSRDPANEAAELLRDSLENSRLMLEQVRRRLDQTRERVARATERVERDVEAAAAGMGQSSAEQILASEALRDSQEQFDRAARFITRLDTLTQTLSNLSYRAASLSSATGAGNSPPPPSSFVPSSALLESPSSAANTDSIRHTVRQLVTASRRVTAAIDRHRESVAAAVEALPPAARVGESEDSPLLPTPLPRSDQPLRVLLPPQTAVGVQENETAGMPSPSSTGTPVTPFHAFDFGFTAAPPSSAAALAAEESNTTLNPAGLLLPTSTGSYPLTASPLPISPAPDPASYPPPSVPTTVNPAAAVAALPFRRVPRAGGSSPPSSSSAYPSIPHLSLRPPPRALSDLDPETEIETETEAETEHYPGERAQLDRIARLQRDIALRAGELRDLRGRADELGRPSPLSSGPAPPAGEEEEDKDDEEEEEDERAIPPFSQSQRRGMWSDGPQGPYFVQRGYAHPSVPISPRRAARRRAGGEGERAGPEAVGVRVLSVSGSIAGAGGGAEDGRRARGRKMAEERRREYEVWARAGR